MFLRFFKFLIKRVFDVSDFANVFFIYKKTLRNNSSYNYMQLKETLKKINFELNSRWENSCTQFVY